MSKICIKKLKSYKKLKGNFLALENEKVITAGKRAHCLFMDDKAENAEEAFKKYILDFCGVCSKVENKPSVVSFNWGIDEDEGEKILGKIYKKFYTDEKGNVVHDENGEGGFNGHILFHSFEPAIMFADKDKFLKVLDDALAVRSVFYPNYQNDLYFILNCFEDFDFDYESLKMIFGICYFRGITFIIRIKNKEKFIEKYSQEAFDNILYFCQIRFNGNGGFEKVSLRENGKIEAFDLKNGKKIK